MRYFYVTYSAQGATGACTTVATKFINAKQFKESIKKEFPELNNIFIMTWVEMTEDDYLLFIDTGESL